MTRIHIQYDRGPIGVGHIYVDGQEVFVSEVTVRHTVQDRPVVTLVIPLRPHDFTTGDRCPVMFGEDRCVNDIGHDSPHGTYEMPFP